MTQGILNTYKVYRSLSNEVVKVISEDCYIHNETGDLCFDIDDNLVYAFHVWDRVIKDESL